MTTRHPSHGTSRVGASLALSLAAALAAGVWLASRAFVQPGAPLDPNIPNEQALIAAGLVGVPGRDQPTRPVAVDRVLVDGAATYVQYHITAPGAPEEDLFPKLVDDQGSTINANALGGYWYAPSPAPVWTIPVALPSWIPWRPPKVLRGYDIIQFPLPATARAAVLRFDSDMPGAGKAETVRVPLDLRALARRRVAHPSAGGRASGLTLTLRDLAFAHLTYTYALPHDATTNGPRVRLTDGAGRIVSTTAFDPDCADDTSGTGGQRCDATVVFPPQPVGARLTLTITALPVNNRLRPGPWRFSFVVP